MIACSRVRPLAFAGFAWAAAVACGGDDGAPPADVLATATFDDASCATVLRDGTRLWCYHGPRDSARSAGYRAYLAEVPRLDDFNEPYRHRYFVLTHPDQVSHCADARGFTPGMGQSFGLGGFECSTSRVWDRHQPGYRTYDVAFCVAPDRATARWVVEPFQSPAYRMVVGPFERVCGPCEPDMTQFCEGAT